jgi:CPA2 family monovalent cation:H+ antiporter-2
MITLTLVEDLAVVILTVLLPSLGSNGGADYVQVLWKIGKALLILIPVVFVGWKVIPRILNRLERTCSNELSLLFGLTISLVGAAIAEAAGLSLALGAFVGGMLLGSSHYAHKLAAQTHSIRDAFVALFFVSIGLIIDPLTWFSHWRLLLVMVALILGGKFVVWTTIVRVFGYPAQTALRVGLGLTQIGEFSFILAQLSLHSGLIEVNVYHATLAASLLTILVNASLFKLLKATPALRGKQPISA